MTWVRARSGPVTVYVRGDDPDQARAVLRRQLHVIHVLQQFFPVAEVRLTPLEIYVIGARSTFDDFNRTIWEACVGDWCRFHNLGGAATDELDRTRLPGERGDLYRPYHERAFGRDVIISVPRYEYVGVSGEVASWYLSCHERLFPTWVTVGASLEFASVTESDGELCIGAAVSDDSSSWAHSNVVGGGPSASSGGYNAVGFSPSFEVDPSFAPWESVMSLADPLHPGPEFKDTVQPYPVTCAIILRLLTTTPQKNLGESIRRYVELSSSGRLTVAEACQQAFGASPAELSKRLRRYVGGGGLRALPRGLPLPPEPAIKVERVTGVDYEHMLALLLGCVSPDFTTRRLLADADAARTDWFLEAVRSRAALASGDAASAVGDAERAIQLKPSLAWLRVMVAEGEIAMGDDPRLTADQRGEALGKALVQLRQAMAADLRPRTAVRSFAQLAGSASAVQPLDLKILAAAAQLYPDDTDILSGLALVEAHLGRHRASQQTLEALLGRKDLGSKFRAALERVAQDGYVPAVLEEVDDLAQTSGVDAAMVRYDALLSDPTAAPIRVRLAAERPTVLWTARWSEMTVLAKRAEWDHVRQRLGVLVETAPTAARREQAQRVLADLGNRQ